MRGKLKEKQRKMKKIEASMIKKDFEDQFIAFCQFGFGISFRERRVPRGEIKQERKGRKMNDNESKGYERKVGSSVFNKRICR